MTTPLRGAAWAAWVLTLGLAACTKEAAAPTTSASATPTPDSQRTSAVAAATTTTVNGVMLQGFYWDTPISSSNQTWWQVLGGKASEFNTAGFTAVWLPPAYKGWNPNQNPASMDEGYGVYDRYDLGEFNQKGSVATRYGTLAQLQSCITALHNSGLQVYEDMVMNHLNGADSPETVTMLDGSTQSLYTKFNYAARNGAYSSYTWQYYNFNGQGKSGGFYQWHAWDFDSYEGGEAYDPLLGDEIRYSDTNQVNEAVTWGKWLTTKLNLDGYRVDAAPHMLTSFLNTWFDNVNPNGSKFTVSEAWFDQVSYLTDYVSRTGGRTSLFDFPLHNLFKNMSDGNGSWDMQGLKFAGFTEADGAHSVSFVDNHDTDNGSSPIVNLKMLAYAYILLRDKGYPCVFYKDYYNYSLGSQIKTLMAIRKANAYGSGYEYSSADDTDYYAYSRAGDSSHKGLMLLLNDGSAAKSKTIASPWKSAKLVDQTGNYAGTITTDANGNGSFPVNSRSWSVWVVQ